MRTDILRKTALTAAGLIATGGAIAAPATAAFAAPTAQPTAQSQRDGTRVLPVDYEAQPNFYYCGPAAARNALSVQDKDIDVYSMAERMGTTESGTDSINDITPVLNTETGSDVYRSVEISTPEADDKQTDTLREDIIRTVDDGRAVVANIAGTATDTNGESHSFAGGHYIAVNGYRDGGDQVKIADSANPNTAEYWITTEALADWIATRGYSTS